MCPSDVAGGFPWPRQKPSRRMQKWPFFDWPVNRLPACASQTGNAALGPPVRVSDSTNLSCSLACHVLLQYLSLKMSDSISSACLCQCRTCCYVTHASCFLTRDCPETGLIAKQHVIG